MKKEPINPIGECFDSAAFNFAFNEGEPKPNERMCHGIGIANMPGQEGQAMAHAWIEFNHKSGVRLAFDTTWGEYMRAEKYRADLKLSYVVEYTLADFLEKWRLTDYPGPWDPKILEVSERADARKEALLNS